MTFGSSDALDPEWLEESLEELVQLEQTIATIKDPLQFGDPTVARYRELTKELSVLSLEDLRAYSLFLKEKLGPNNDLPGKLETLQFRISDVDEFLRRTSQDLVRLQHLGETTLFELEKISSPAAYAALNPLFRCYSEALGTLLQRVNDYLAQPYLEEDNTSAQTDDDTV